MTITIEDDALAKLITEAVAKEISLLEQRIALLEARPMLRDRGIWQTGATYQHGDICSHAGSAWLCSADHVATGTSPHHDCFRLFVKKGNDAPRGERR